MAIAQQVERLAELLVLAEPSDLRSLADLHTGFEEVVRWAKDNGLAEVRAATQTAASLLEKVILDEVPHRANSLDLIGRVVSVLQQVVRDGRCPEEVTWPAELGLDGKRFQVRPTRPATDGPVAGPGRIPATADEPASSPPTGAQGATPDETAPRRAERVLPGEHPLEGDTSLLGEFITEAREHLDAADVHLLTLETDPHDEEALNAVFRAFHTIKGVSGFLALDEIQVLAHEAENLLDRARKRQQELVDAAIDVTFDAVDMLKQLVENVSNALAGGGPLRTAPQLPRLLAEIKAVAAGKTPTQPKTAQLPEGAPGERLGEILVDHGIATADAVEHAIRQQREAPSPKKLGEILTRSGKTTPALIRTAIDLQRQNPERGRTGEILVEMGAIQEADLQTALRVQQEPAQPSKLGALLVQSGEAAAKEVAHALRSQKLQSQAGVPTREPVKVDGDRLDHLVDMIGELVIAESMVVQSPQWRDTRSPEWARRVSQLDKITRELQEIGTSLRMVPIRATFQKMARLVRDLAKKAGKPIEFATAGEDTELDKTVVDKIGDPLVHMIRNAVDHGIESDPEERRRLGKPPVARIELRAFHRGGNICIEIEDDGRGLNHEAILAKARERGLIREGDSLSEREICGLICEPGFSTAEEVTDVSGRGVGMDVVKRNIEALRGQLDIESETGKGTVFSIRLPLTLAIIDGMVLRVGHERYILPTLSIITSLRPEAERVATVMRRGEMLMLQGRLLPLFRLADLFHISEAVRDVTQGIVVVVEEEGRQTGLFVDEILGKQPIVIKSLGGALRGLPGIAGGAIMPDGTVGLILDVGGLVKLANEGLS